MRLSRRYHYQFRHLYFDNFFSSVNLLEYLLAKYVYACVTIKKNHAQLPQIIKTPGRLQRGQGVMSQKGNIECVVWRDKRYVRVISTNSQPRFTTVPCHVKGRVQEIECPESVVQYNKHMEGVDLADQNRSYYSVGRDSKKFWKSLLWYTFNAAIVNSYILLKQSLPRPLTRDQVNLTQWKYRLSLVDQLVCGFSNRKRLVDEGHIIGHEREETYM